MQNKSLPATASSQDNSKSDLLCTLLLTSIVIGLTLLWFSFDHHFPSQDEAGHIMNSMSFRDLLAHCRPWRYHWWYQCLTVNGFYPPFVYFINGCFLLTFGQSRFIEQLSVAFFTGLMTAATYAIVRILNGSRRTACIAAICLYLYPVISSLSHSFLLDLQAVSMTAFALMALLWWQSFPTPTWRHTIVTALAVGCACLSKQLVAAYLIPLGFYYLLTDIVRLAKKQKPDWLMHTLLIGVITVFIGLPFVILNHQCITSMNQSFADAIAFKHEHSSYLHNIILYCQLLPQQMSPLLLTIFLFSLFFTPKHKHLLLTPITISALGGFAFTCTSNWAGLIADQRYTAPALIAAAIYSAFFLERLISSPKQWQKALAIIAIALASLDYFSFNFVPYPLPLPLLPWQTSISDHDGNPVPPVDWGHTLVLETIEKTDSHKSEYLNILTNSPMLNVHTFELLLKEKNNNTIIPTSSRSWTIIGDTIDFNPTTALYYQWYLLKNGSSGYYFHDKQSELNFKRLVDFVCHSGKYKLIIQKTLPDNSVLMLYRRCY